MNKIKIYFCKLLFTRFLLKYVEQEIILIEKEQKENCNETDLHKSRYMIGESIINELKILVRVFDWNENIKEIINKKIFIWENLAEKEKTLFLINKNNK